MTTTPPIVPVQPFPYSLPPISNITPFTYPDGTTYVEILRTLQRFVNETVIPGFNANVDAALAEFQAGIANAEATIQSIKAANDAAIAAFEAQTQTTLDGYSTDLSGVKADWTSQFNAFMADVNARLAALNDAAVSGLVNDTTTQLNAALRTFAKNLPGFVDPAFYGAKGDGTTDDTSALNAAYAAAAAAKVPVALRGRTYRATGQVYAVGASTLGEGGTLAITVVPAAGSAFKWGGTDTFIDGVRFQLSNTDTTAAVQGILNSEKDAARQRFTRNTVTTLTAKADGTANIYGAWFTGTGLAALVVANCTFKCIQYGIQVNIQNAAGDNTFYGNPLRGIAITGNVLTDCTIGINTPHQYCTDVAVTGNTVRGVNVPVDMPVNIAHVTGLTVTGNTLRGNRAGTHGTLHIEDASGEVTVTGNTIRQDQAEDGIVLTVQVGVSHDPSPTAARVVISGNHIWGPGKASTGKNGINIGDSATVATTIAGNYVGNYANGITPLSRSNVIGNTIEACANGISIFRKGNYEGNMLYNVDTPYVSAENYQVIKGGLVHSAAGMVAPSKTSTGGYVEFEKCVFVMAGATLTPGTGFNLMPLPAGKFSGKVVIGYDTKGFSSQTITWDGTTFTATRNADAQPLNLGGTTLTRSADGTTLVATVSGSGATTMDITVTIDGLVY